MVTKTSGEQRVMIMQHVRDRKRDALYTACWTRRGQSFTDSNWLVHVCACTHTQIHALKCTNNRRESFGGRSKGNKQRRERDNHKRKSERHRYNRGRKALNEGRKCLKKENDEGVEGLRWKRQKKEVQEQTENPLREEDVATADGKRKREERRTGRRRKEENAWEEWKRGRATAWQSDVVK